MLSWLDECFFILYLDRESAVLFTRSRVCKSYTYIEILLCLWLFNSTIKMTIVSKSTVLCLRVIKRNFSDNLLQEMAYLQNKEFDVDNFRSNCPSSLRIILCIYITESNIVWLNIFYLLFFCVEQVDKIARIILMTNEWPNNQLMVISSFCRACRLQNALSNSVQIIRKSIIK